MRNWRELFIIVIVAALAHIKIYAEATIEDIENLKKTGYSEKQILEEMKAMGGFSMKPSYYARLRKQGFSTKFMSKILALNANPKFPRLPKKLLPHAYKTNFAESKKIWAVVLGVNVYKNKQFPELKWAVKDAEDFCCHLLSIGVPKEQICFLKNNEITPKKIQEVVNEAIKAKGTLYFFYAGHGLYSNKNGFYFTCYDSDIKNLDTTGYAMTNLKSKLEQMQRERAILLIDACHSGGSRDE